MSKVVFPAGTHGSVCITESASPRSPHGDVEDERIAAASALRGAQLRLTGQARSSNAVRGPL